MEPKSSQKGHEAYIYDPMNYVQLLIYLAVILITRSMKRHNCIHFSGCLLRSSPEKVLPMILAGIKAAWKAFRRRRGNGFLFFIPQQ